MESFLSVFLRLRTFKTMKHTWLCCICELVWSVCLHTWHLNFCCGISLGGFILPQSKVSPSQEVTVTVTLHCTRKVLEGISPQYFFKDVGKTPSQVSLKLFPHSISPGITSQYLCRSLSSQYLSKYFTSHSISLEVFPHSISQSILFRSISLEVFPHSISESIFYLAVSLWKYSLTVSLWKYNLTVSLKVFTSQYLSGSTPSQYTSATLQIFLHSAKFLFTVLFEKACLA